MSNDETVAPPPSGPSVGSQLKSARESRGLSVGDIAKAQHLRPAVIQAIEDGEYGEIGSELFLKGYVRTYAGQVGLNADKLLAELDRELEPLRREHEHEQENHPLVTIEERKERKRRVARGLLVLLFVLVAGFITYKVFIADITGPDSAATTSESVEEASPVVSPSEDEVEPEEPAASTPPEVTPPAGADQKDDIVDAPEPAAADEAPLAQPAPEESLAASQEEVLEDEGAVESAAPLATPVEEAPVEEPAVATSSQARLLITFSADCWVQVTDAGGRRLASRLRRSGDRLDVTGTAPLRVVIGAVDAVETIRFQGQAVDLRDVRVVNNRAEFALGN